MSASITPLAYVYDGRRCLGHIIARDMAGFEAFDANDGSLGLFPPAVKRNGRAASGDTSDATRDAFE
jgi:hypothetical protein